MLAPMRRSVTPRTETKADRDERVALRAETCRLIALLESHRIERRARQQPFPPPIEPSRPSTQEKVALFRRLFRGRTDVFPVRWESKTTGTSGYAPACANGWRAGVCEKPRIKCGDCALDVRSTLPPGSVRITSSPPGCWSSPGPTRPVGRAKPRAAPACAAAVPRPKGLPGGSARSPAAAVSRRQDGLAPGRPSWASAVSPPRRSAPSGPAATSRRRPRRR